MILYQFFRELKRPDERLVVYFNLQKRLRQFRRDRVLFIFKNQNLQTLQYPYYTQFYLHPLY